MRAMRLTPTFHSMSASRSTPARPITVGSSRLVRGPSCPKGTFVEIDSEAAYRIEDVDALAPFFVTVVSDADHWLFASSAGALSAGRVAPKHALFPY